ncbi:unnamed protein product [Acanthoscelides obtectus]|uniref:Mutator-like transposase domain-containing protein n=1 Tax=Acanthoscelides obtectus TaxID=200917 RepID=A0A9P0L474_ACAOB|nr:unnamed protein product [Acanthoscelides obtectus]CAK1624102.1 hypothetical protein AOBTE_LOCUS2325 [Acanthoscelides obtectus]
MKATGKEEKSVAIEKGHVMPDGTPYITVFADGGWNKRIYGHGYNAPSKVGNFFMGESGAIFGIALQYIFGHHIR